MGFQTVLVEYEGAVCTLTLNRPEKRNAMNGQLAGDFQGAVQAIQDERRARVLIVTGAGSAFCAGGDFDYFPRVFETGPQAAEAGMFDFYSCFLCLTDLRIPTIAAINGPAMGAGACLAAACDMRFAARSATMGFNFVKIGVSPGMGAEYFLSRLVGPARTMELLMTGDVIDAEEAFRMGLVNRVADREALMGLTAAFARKLADLPAMPIQVVKETTHLAMTGTLRDILRREAHYQSLCYQAARG